MFDFEKLSPYEQKRILIAQNNEIKKLKKIIMVLEKELNSKKEYRIDRTVLNQFIDENCDIHPAAKIEAKSLYENYTKWCFQNNEVYLKNRSFYRQLEIRGFEKEKGAGNKTFIIGITLNEFVGENLFTVNTEEETL